MFLWARTYVLYMIAFLKEFFEKVNFEKKSEDDMQQKNEKLLNIQRDNGLSLKKSEFIKKHMIMKWNQVYMHTIISYTNNCHLILEQPKIGFYVIVNKSNFFWRFSGFSLFWYLPLLVANIKIWKSHLNFREGSDKSLSWSQTL